MNNPSNVDSLLGSYNDRERLALIGRLFKDGHINEDEFLNLLTGDRNFFLTNTLEQIQKTLEKAYTPTYPNNWGTGIVYATGTKTYSAGGSIYNNSATNP